MIFQIHLFNFAMMESPHRGWTLLISTTIFIGLISKSFTANISEILIPDTTNRSGCVMPQSMTNGTYSLRGSNVVKEEQLAPYNSILLLTCPSGYLPSNSGVNFCDDTKNDWFEEELATCQKTCKPPKSKTVEFTCTIPSKNGQFITGSCDTNLPSGTTATPKCRSGHHSLTTNKNIFCTNGRWGYSMPSCKAGEPRVNDMPTDCVFSPVTQTTVPGTQTSNRTDGCVIPNHPLNGRYTALNLDDKKPGDIVPPHSTISLKCSSGYSSNPEINICDDNTNNWKSDLGTCLKMCDSLDSLTVKFNCSNPLSKEKDLVIGCDVPVPSGSLATVTCEVGHYSKERLPTLLCKDGSWDQSIPKCTAICGKLASDSLIISEDNDKYAKKGEFPWHAAIYYKRPNDMLRYHCGGNIISRLHIITTGHCVSPLGLPVKPRELLVAVGKLFSELNHTEEIEDAYIQKIQVKKFELPNVFGALADEYTSDLGILVLETPIIFSEYVMPICLDLQDSEKDKQQSKDGTLSRVAGFGYETEEGPISPRLKALTLPIIDLSKCRKIANENFMKDLTTDRICAGAIDGSANLCIGDSGSGLAISNMENGTTVWYLRGVAILVPSCDPQYLIRYTVFTRPLYYTYFIESVLNATVSD